MPKLREPLLFRVVYEIRYRDGELYWDHSGRVRRSLRGLDAAWQFADTPERNFWPCALPFPASTSAKPAPEATLQLNFGALKLDFTFAAPVLLGISKFPFDTLFEKFTTSAQCVLDGLGVEAKTRVGLRQWLIFRCDSREDARDQLEGTSFSGEAPETGELGEQFAAMKIQRFKVDDCQARIAVGDVSATFAASGERIHGILLDVDHASEGAEQIKLDDQIEKSRSYIKSVVDLVWKELSEKA